MKLLRFPIAICLLFLCANSLQAEMTDLWSYWRFHVGKGYYKSLLENLQKFTPQSVFDEQKKNLLKVYLYTKTNQRDLAEELLNRSRDTMPLFADYLEFLWLQNRFEKDQISDEYLERLESYSEDFPNSVFLPTIIHMRVQSLSKSNQCGKVDALFESIQSASDFITTEDYQQDMWVFGFCAIKVGRKDRGIHTLKKLWVETLDNTLLSQVENSISKAGGSYTISEIIERMKFLKRMARYDEAIALLKQRIPAKECYAECLKLEASLYFANKQYKEAVTAYQFLYGMLKEAQFLYLSCRSMARAGEVETANQCYITFDRQPRLRATNRMTALYFRGQLLMDNNRLQEAVNVFEKVAAFKMKHFFVRRSLWNMGWISLHLKKPEEALKYFRRIKDSGLEPLEFGQGTYWEAKSLIQMGKNKEALQIYDEIRRETPLSYYGILAQNRVEELAGKAGMNVLKPFLIPRRIPATKIGVTDEELRPHLNSAEAFRLYFQLHEFADIGMMEEARLVLRKLLSISKFSAELKAKLYVLVQDYYQAIQLSYAELGYDQTKYPEKENDFFYWYVLYPFSYQGWIEPLSKEYYFNPFILYSIMRSESLFRETIISQAGAIGLLQIMPYTGKKLAEKLNLRHFEVSQLKIPHVNILLSARYIHDLIYKMDGQLIFTIAGYNAGPHNVSRWMKQFQTDELDEFIERIPYVETRKYVMKNIHFLAVYNYLYHPDETGFRVANSIHSNPNPLLNTQDENWDYDVPH